MISKSRTIVLTAIVFVMSLTFHDRCLAHGSGFVDHLSGGGGGDGDREAYAGLRGEAHRDVDGGEKGSKRDRQSSSLRAGDVETWREPIPDNLRSVVDCRFSKKHRRFPECRCGEYVVQVPRADIPADSLHEYHVKVINMFYKKERRIYYTCFFCSLCPDGVRTTKKCSKDSDTQCSPNNECVDREKVFDQGRKACIRDPNIPTEALILNGKFDSTTTSRSTNQDARKSSERKTESTKELEYSSSSIPTSLLHDPIVVFFMAVLLTVVFTGLLVNIVVCVTFIRAKRSKDGSQTDNEALVKKSTSTSTITNV